MAYVVSRAPIRRQRAIRLGGLTGLRGIDTDQQMIAGSPYTFYFNYGRLGLAIDPTSIPGWLSGDSNFGSPLATIKSGYLSNQVAVSFTYKGKGSTVGNAGLEMQNVLNSHLIVTKLYFDSADGPSGAPGLPLNVTPNTGNAANNNSGGGLSYTDVLSLWRSFSGGNGQPVAIPWGTIGLIGGGTIIAAVAVSRLFGRR